MFRTSRCGTMPKLCKLVQEFYKSGHLSAVAFFLARDVIYRHIHLALMLRCQCPSVCDGSALAHYI